jgi:hypothetical protein
MGKPVRVDLEAMRSLQEPGPECGLVHGVPTELAVRRKLVKRFAYLIIFIEIRARRSRDRCRTRRPSPRLLAAANLSVRRSRLRSSSTRSLKRFQEPQGRVLPTGPPENPSNLVELSGIEPLAS